MTIECRFGASLLTA